MYYFGKITRTEGDNVYVIIDEFAGGAELGPFPAMVTDRWDEFDDITSSSTSLSVSGSTDSANGPDAHSHGVSIGIAGHTHTTAQEIRSSGYLANDRVLVARIGHIKEKMIVLGRIQ
jgi:hypothetical protein